MRIIHSLQEFNTYINIIKPKWEHFDTKKFEDHLWTVNLQLDPCRHLFFVVWLKIWWTENNFLWSNEASEIFFESPYQLISRDINADRSGYYIIFTQEFISQNYTWINFMSDYPFFSPEKLISFNLTESHKKIIIMLFEQIYDLAHNNTPIKIIAAFIQCLLETLWVYYLWNNTQDIPARHDTSQLFIQFRNAIYQHIGTSNSDVQYRKPSFYATNLHISTIRLNAICLQITWSTTTAFINDYIIMLAKMMLNKWLLVKEISHILHFKESDYFCSFFKKITWHTPNEYRTLNW